MEGKVPNVETIWYSTATFYSTKECILYRDQTLCYWLHKRAYVCLLVRCTQPATCSAISMTARVHKAYTRVPSAWQRRPDCWVCISIFKNNIIHSMQSRALRSSARVCAASRRSIVLISKPTAHSSNRRNTNNCKMLGRGKVYPFQPKTHLQIAFICRAPSSLSFPQTLLSKGD